MNWRDELAEDMGYTICPLHYETYIHCDNKCEGCELYKDFLEFLKVKDKRGL